VSGRAAGGRMGGFAQLVIGPAGCGKSTYCAALGEHAGAVGRALRVVNLDPAAERFAYAPALDVRDLVTVPDVMEALGLGPNGALIYCMEYLEAHLSDWLAPALEEFGEGEYLVFDCPGQIELYSHVPAFRGIVERLRAEGFQVAAVYMLDAHFMADAAKFIAGSLQALAAMARLELPHLNVVTKLDMLEPDNREEVQRYLDLDARELRDALQADLSPGFRRLNEAVAALVDEHNMVSYCPLDYSDEDSLQDLLAQVDNAIQYGEDLEVRDTLRASDEAEAERAWEREGQAGLGGLHL